MDKYIHSLDKTLYELDLDEVKKIVNVLLEAKRNKKFVYIFGNGGSSSTVSHFVNDLQKIASVKALSLNDNVPLMTAWGNDESFSSIFSRQLSNLVSDGDIVIAISASGNSKNIIEALELVSELNVITIGLTGNDGGKLKNLVDYCIKVPNKDICKQEDVHLIICHMIAKAIRENND